MPDRVWRIAIPVSAFVAGCILGSGCGGIAIGLIAWAPMLSMPDEPDRAPVPAIDIPPDLSIRADELVNKLMSDLGPFEKTFESGAGLNRIGLKDATGKEPILVWERNGWATEINCELNAERPADIENVATILGNVLNQPMAKSAIRLIDAIQECSDGDTVTIQRSGRNVAIYRRSATEMTVTIKAVP